jgi:two-component system KDP operon response regulator KdpE
VPHLLVVEDDPGASFVMTAALKFGGYTCETVSTAIEALRRTGERSYDMILIDLGLPDLDGEQLIKTLQFHNDVPIIIVSGRSGEQDKVDGLDAGADDFVAKPYSPSELLARIRAVLRRAPKAQPSQSDNDAAASSDRPLAAARGGDLQLAGLSKQLFDLLSSADGEAVPVEDIALALWGAGEKRGPHRVRVLVGGLRKELRASGGPLQLLNDRGLGYRFSAPSEQQMCATKPLGL